MLTGFFSSVLHICLSFQTYELRKNVVVCMDLLGRCVSTESLQTYYQFNHRNTLLAHLQVTPCPLPGDLCCCVFITPLMCFHCGACVAQT